MDVLGSGSQGGVHVRQTIQSGAVSWMDGVNRQNGCVGMICTLVPRGREFPFTVWVVGRELSKLVCTVGVDVYMSIPSSTSKPLLDRGSICILHLHRG